MRLSQPIQVGDYAVLGVDDWLVFARDRAGKWVYWHTECDPVWNDIANATGRNSAGLGDDPPEEIVTVGVNMAMRGVNPYRIEEPSTVADCEAHFGPESSHDSR